MWNILAKVLGAANPWLGAAAAAAGAYGDYQEAKAQQKSEQQSAQYNEQVATRNAQLARDQAAEEERRYSIDSRMKIGEMRAALGASGTQLTGTPMDLLEQAARISQQDILSIRRQGELQAQSFEMDAAMEHRRYKSAGRAGFQGKLAAVLSGGFNTANAFKWTGPSAPGRSYSPQFKDD